MRILHLCLACFYIDGYSYQENIIPRINKEDGHDVKIIASTETFINNANLGYVSPSRYTTEYGVPIVRLGYVKILNNFISSKMRMYKGLYREIETFMPDIIFCHDMSFLSLRDVIKYVEKHQNVVLYSDTHTSALNSGRNPISLFILHRLIYRHVMKKAIPLLRKYFYITEYEKDFSIKNYKIPEEIMEFYPLGGEILPDSIYYEKRKRIRKQLGVPDDGLLFVHSGKMSAEKRTITLINAFLNSKLQNAKLVLIGSIPNENSELLVKLRNMNDHVLFLGWMNSSDLQDYLCAADLYCQPGSESSTMENSVCCRCPVVVRKGSSYSYEEDYGNLFWIDTEEDIISVFNYICDNQSCLKEMSENSYKCALELLDYKKLSARIYH